MKPSTVLMLITLTHVSYVAHSSLLQPFTTALKLLGSYSRSAVFLNTDLGAVLKAPNDRAAAVLVVSGPGTKPVRRLDKQPIISCAPSAATVIPQSVQQALLATLHQVETLRGVRLYPLLLDVLPDDAFQQHASAEQQGPPPWVVYDVSAGRLVLRQQLLEVVSSSPAQATAVLVNACVASVGQLTNLMKQVPGVADLRQLTDIVSSAMAAGVAAAFTVAAAGPPKWFCFVCPIVLGLLAPLVINAGVGEAADMACKEMQLTDEECVDLWFTALALGMILSLLSAIPIYKVCRLYECAHLNIPASTATATS